MNYPVLKPNSSWFIPLDGTLRNTITTIQFYNSKSDLIDQLEGWDASISQDGSIQCFIDGTTLYICGNGSGKIALSPDARYTFSNIDEVINEKGESIVENLDIFSALTTINGLELLDTSAVTNMDYMFHRCTALTSLDVSTFDTSNVTSMSHMFGDVLSGSMALTAINFGQNFVKNTVIDLSYMFYFCNKLTALDIDDWDVSNVTTMSNMFKSCESLTTFGPDALANWDTGNVIYMDQAFRWLKKLTAFNLEHWDVSKVKNFYACFCNGAWTTVLDLDAWDTSSCENVSFMFHSFKTLTTLKVNGWDVRNIKTFDHFIAQMGSNFKNMDVSNWQVTNKCENLNAVFHGYKGTTLDVSGWDTSNVKVFCQMFDGCSNLTEIKGLQDLNTSNGRDFTEMFIANKIKHLDLSFMDTRKATPGYPLSANGTNGGGMHKMMYGSWNNLEKITFGPYFSFDGDGSCVEGVEIHHDGYPNETEILDCRFTIPKSKTGYWYSLDGTQYVTDIPDDTGAVYFRNLEDALKEAESKKYVSLGGLRTYHSLQTAKINEKLATKADIDHNHNEDYEIKGAAEEALNSAKIYADEAAAIVKNDLLNGAGDAYDTLKELGDLIDENVTALDALETIALSKADKEYVDNLNADVLTHIETVETNATEKVESAKNEANAYTDSKIAKIEISIENLNGQLNALIEVTNEEIDALFIE